MVKISMETRSRDTSRRHRHRREIAAGSREVTEMIAGEAASAAGEMEEAAVETGINSGHRL